ncbi:hypothetical protein [Streptosporangium sp. NPDC048865]|uniref:hypothetical protein n=1 Tax=Streptosporangium sp. NPDC048865 TaxID=3155766 RepID=UPI003415F466
MSKQTSFTLMLLLAFSVVVPGSAGYLSVKMEAIDRAHRELLTLESRIRAERLAARIRKLERTHRDRRLQPITSSGRRPCAPYERSRDEPGPRTSGPAAVAPVPVAGAEGPHGGRPHAWRHIERYVAQGENLQKRDVREQPPRRPDTSGPGTEGPGTPWQDTRSWQDAREPGARGLTAQGRLEAGTTGDAVPVERWSQLERRGRPHREDEARTEHRSVVPDATGGGNVPEVDGASPGEGLPPAPPRTGARDD